MSRSFHTDPERVVAGRNREGPHKEAVPRVLERAPKPGDIHPLTRKTLQNVLPHIPTEYLFGLSRIELRARNGPKVGQPFGIYWKDERSIILYSLPPGWTTRSTDLLTEYKRYGATVEPQPDGHLILLTKPARLTLWFYAKVFTHELGHHFTEQYKMKNSRIRSRRLEELIAELHAKTVVRSPAEIKRCGAF